MAQIMSLGDAVSAFIRDGDMVALEGFTHLIPFAAGHEIIRQGRRDLTVVRLTPDLLYDQLIGMGCVRKLIFSWGGNPGVGSLHRLRDAVERSWPGPIELEEHSHAALANAYEAGAAGMPFAAFRGYLGTDYEKINPNIKRIACPFTGEQFAAGPAVLPDVAVIHAQCADRRGNVLINGISGVQREAVLAARHAIVTVEEIVETLEETHLNAVILPQFVVTAVCLAPRGAHPSYVHGFYKRDNVFYKAWDGISRDRDAFLAWMKRYVTDMADFSGTWEALREDGYV